MSIDIGQTTAGWLFSINHALPMAVGVFPMVVVVGLALNRHDFLCARYRPFHHGTDRDVRAHP